MCSKGLGRAVPTGPGHLLIVDFQGGEQQPLQRASKMGRLRVTGGQREGLLGLALLQEAAQQAGQHWLALRKGMETGIGGMSIREGL